MNIAIFRNVKEAKSGKTCTPALFWDIVDSPQTLMVVKAIRAIVDDLDFDLNKEAKEKIADLKKQLPVITWQADFEDGYRKDVKAIPSGLYMVDIDGCGKEKMMEYILKAKSLMNELGIVYIGETPKYGVRIVACCRPELNDIAECQQWMFDRLEIPQEYRDEVCVDWARCSFMMPQPLIHYINAQIFTPDFTCHTYENLTKRGIKAKIEKVVKGDGGQNGKAVNQTQMPFDTGQNDYKGIPLKEIARAWYEANGGEPVEGNRNNSIFKLAIRMRYICDFNEAVLYRSLDSYGLSEQEMRSVIHSAIVFARSVDAPQDLYDVIEKLQRKKDLLGEDEEEIELIDINDTSKTPSLPPVFKEWYDVAPNDFKIPSVVIQLPILGALGSRLRATMTDGEYHTPSFLVSLEAPQASGKSFMRKIINVDLALMKEHDSTEREKELEYNDKVAKIKMLNTKVTKKDQDSVLGDKPQALVRYCPATMSITQLLRRMHNAKGLHLFAMAEEIDTVYKAFKRGFSSFSDALRCAFDNAEYGQDYASENSFSGIVRLYYNVLYSGTPKAMRRFYPDVEDGLVSRVFFCTLPDQFCKPRPVWQKFTKQQWASLQLGLTRLNEITLQGEDVQEPHVMRMEWLAEDMDKWILAQQALAAKTDDRTRDIFCRRSAVVGFRAGMLAWFLWGEIPQRRKSVVAFSRWIANLMLKQHLTRFQIEKDEKNTVPYADLFNAMPDDFNFQQLKDKMALLHIESRVNNVVARWRMAGLISPPPVKNIKKAVISKTMKR